MIPIPNHNTNATGTDEKTLLLKISHGDGEAFTQLYRTHAPWLQEYISFFTGITDAEEVLQEIFLKVWERKEDILPGVESFEAYIRIMARNMTLNHLRQVKKLRKIKPLEHADDIHAGDRPDHNALIKEYSRITAKAIDQLPPRRKEVTKLKLEKNLNNKEIAQKLKLTNVSVKKHLFVAFNYIKKYLKEHAEIHVTKFMLFVILIFR